MIDIIRQIPHTSNVILNKEIIFMSKKSMLNLLLISAILLLADSLAGWILFDLGALAAVVLSVIFLVNARKVFGSEVESARSSCLWNVIANGSLFLLNNTIGIVLAIVTFGISAILGKGVETLANIAFGIWQLVAWSKLKAAVGTTAATV
jgi:hypothetical protein